MTTKSVERIPESPPAPSWQAIAEKKRKERGSKIPKEWILQQIPDSGTPISILRSCGVLNEDELGITDPSEHDATALLQKIAAREMSSTQLVRTFCKRAAVAHQLTNCLTEILFDQAIARAEWLDRQYQMTGKVVGPLHGLPITVKDCFHVKGYDTSIGISSLCYKPAERDSLLVEILSCYGAVIIAKTTVPQTMLNADTDSIVFGRTLNPYNRSFAVAGSSGGEGALLAMGGTSFGLGTDGAGSVRMPAAVNGVIGYKPSGYRMPLDGIAVMGPGVVGTTSMGPVTVAGVLARSARDVKLVAQLVAEAKPWTMNPFLYPHPWQGSKNPTPKDLRIGVWSSNGYVHLHAPVERGFQTAQRRLREAAVELVDFKGPDISDVWNLQKAWADVQGLSFLRECLSKEPHTEIVKATGIIDPKDKRPELNMEYLHSLNVRISTLVRQMHAAWSPDGKPIDALLWVTAPHTAVPFDKYTYLGLTAIFNIIDWPAMALPLNMFVDAGIDKAANVKPFNSLDEEIQALYDPAAFHGLPLSVQLVGRRFEDEKLLAITQVVHDIIKAC